MSHTFHRNIPSQLFFPGRRNMLLSFGSFSPKENAIFLVEKYYETLVKHPESAAQVFYAEGSSVKLNDGASEKTASTLASINGLLLSLKYTRVVIENVNCEESLNGVLFVKVAAFAETKKGNLDVRKRFTQVFVLANKGYKFVNDMVQYLETSASSSSAVQQEESAAKEHVLKSAQPDTVKDEVSSSSGENPPKLTFSSVAKIAAPKESETAAVAVAVAVASVPAVQKAKAAAPQKQKEVSVYVKNLPKGSSESDVLAMFKQFGRIKEGGVFVKTIPNTGICYGFVDFEDAEAAQRAVNSSPLIRKSDGWKVYVELKSIKPKAPAPQKQNELSVYVKKLPEGSSESDVRAVFEKFGRIKEVSVDTCGFVVEFEDAEAAQKAVQAKQVTLSDGWKVNVKVEFFKKPSSTNGPSSRGRRGNSTANAAGRKSGRRTN